MAEPLTGLESDYQVLTELYRSAGAITYLARHLQLARDVTLTVVPPSADGGKIDLAQIEADVRTLIALRHPNVIPVLEGRWLDRRSYVVVRARVRGTTLDQLISAIGPVPLVRVRTTLEQVQAALAFARENGVLSRHISSESLVFQQGSGRVLIAFDALPASASTSGSTGEDEDVRTIGRLARIMLSGLHDAGESRKSLAELRPELPQDVDVAADELAVGGNEHDVGAFLSLLASVAGVSASASTGATPSSSTTPLGAASPIPPVAPPPAPRRVTVQRTTIGPQVVTPPRFVAPVSAVAPVAVRPRRFGTGARWATAIGVLIVIVVAAGIAVMQPRLLSSNDVSSTLPPADSPAVATGDVSGTKPGQPIVMPPQITSNDSLRPDSGVKSTVNPTVTPTPASGAASSDSAQKSAATGTVSPSAPPAPPSSIATANPACASGTPADQRKCFIDAVQHADADLNRVYNGLIDALRRQAKTAPADPDPPAVDKLRAAQRAWLDERDRSCQVVSTGIFSGRDRAQCFADRAAKRSHDLQLMLDSIPPGLT